MRYGPKNRCAHCKVVVLCVLISVLSALPPAAQVQFDIVNPTPRPQDSNLEIAGTFGFSVLFEPPSSYWLYATSANQYKTWH